MNNDFNAKLKLLIKSEKALLSLEMKKKAKETLWSALGLVSIFMTLVLLNITLFLYLSSEISNLASSATLTLINSFIAIIFFMIASRQTRGAEAESIEEIRDFAYQQLATDVDDVKANMKEFGKSALKVKENVESFTSGDVFGIKKIIPIVTTLIDVARQHRKSK